MAESVTVVTLPCLSDNFAYLIVPDGSDEALVVDPADARPVVRALGRLGRRLGGILNTHHHWDHTGGNEELLQQFGELPVCGHESDRGRIPGQNRFLADGSALELGGVELRVVHVPGHTRGAIAYLCQNKVFTGDTLFGAGCGRLFEGTPAMMSASLNRKLGALPDDTLVYFGHEYTLSNLRFSAHMEPSNKAVHQRLASGARWGRGGEHSTPSTLGEERRTNSFLRLESEEIRCRLGLARTADPVAVFTAMRRAKDVF